MTKKAKQQQPPPPGPDELVEGYVFEQGDLSPIVEAKANLIVPDKGTVFEEREITTNGITHKAKVGRFAIIRPCISRGKRLRGFSPIYEASMLAEHAGVFSGWPMYADHLTEQLKEAIHEQLIEELGEEKVARLDLQLREAGRSIKEIGGRILKSWYDPNLVTEADAEMGYQKGGVVADVVPQPFIVEMLEADPGILNVSINAWPKKVRVGTASWDKSKRGAVVEGIAAQPMGSVDFVFRGGAGGAPLAAAMKEEDAELAVTILESGYASGREGKDPKEPNEMPQKKLSEMTEAELKALPRDGLKERLEEEGFGHLAAFLVEGKNGNGTGNGGSDTPPASGGISEERLSEMLAEHRKEIEEGLEEKLEETTGKKLTESQTYDQRERWAQEYLAEAVSNSFPKAWADHLAPRYSHLPSAPGDGLKLNEADLEGEDGKLEEKEAIRERVKADVAKSLELIEASTGSAPRVTGFGPAAEADETGGSDGKTKLRLAEGEDDFIDFLRESNDFTGDPKHDEG
ncbi:MAG TPA: hypothetical protein VGV69_11195, partial [Solirubrobacterales bacterium]|nr:hypothetical protein [Solirubrobacterales bacterium]